MGISPTPFACQIASIMLRRFRSWHLFLLAGASALIVWPVLYFGFGALADSVPAGRPRNLVGGAYKLFVLLFAVGIIGLGFLGISRASARIWLSGALGLVIMLLTLIGAGGSLIIFECYGYGRNCF
jgi:hypothetical protein